MPNYNGTGPSGLGAQTGRGMGRCGQGLMPRRGQGQRLMLRRGRGNGRYLGFWGRTRSTEVENKKMRKEDVNTLEQNPPRN